ncbi:DUF3006 domain-containing protein [Natrinema sp. CBA1119]|uniref:DUF3006 domain-containing protein n=1 Tax=Natrinema sp. CBA1119 TaxID=1608465 RepID=UPI000BF967B5|nr:DUF3006 domain-containing protein [Natrinema sp. CBA1119]PGF14335.1 DUF3006 domain-containing protein [Natrinema sp. CBA1119]PGF14435.1 DUF3006 domain-containing protein [Natrinema sp. CBA1119]
MDGTFTGVVDRVVDGDTAVILLEDEGGVVEQLDVDIETLPEEGQHEGALFTVRLEGGGLADLEYQPEREQKRRARLEAKFDRLSKRLDEE